MIKTYTFKVKPHRHLEKTLDRFLGTTRTVYNVAKEVREEAYRKGVSINYYGLSAQLTEAKKEFKWVSEVPAQSLQAILERLENGYKKFFGDLKKGVKTSKPKWAKKGRWNSIPFKEISIKNRRFRLPKLGEIKVFKFKVPKGELRTATLVKEADGWYLKVVVKSDEEKPKNQGFVGIDMGLAYFLTTSDGEFVENPKHLFKYLAQLRIENRALARKKKGSSNWKKQKVKLSRLHQKIQRTRKDFLHKQSSLLAKDFGTVVIEDLNIKAMSKNSRLSKHILDCAWGTFFGMLENKMNVVRVDPKHTSQRCFKCGHVDKNNRKTQSQFECVSCGHTENADLNAGKNILKRGQSLLGANVDH